MKLESEKEVMDAIQLLGWKEISTYKQQKNGTIIYELPILKYGSKIQVGSFQSGYVRRMNGGYTPYQLNKCEPYTEYYPYYKWVNDKQVKTGQYNKYVGKRRIRIPGEVARLRHLVLYCLKNYYINQANEIENGNYIPKWRVKSDHSNCEMNLKYKDNRIKELREKEMKQEKIIRECFEEIDRISEEKDDLHKKIDKSNDYNYDKIECLNMEIDGLNSQLNNTNVVVNGEKYYKKRYKTK